MNKLQFTAEDRAAAAQAVFATFGAAGAMNICKVAARLGRDALATFEAAVAAEICERFGIKPMGLAGLQALKKDARFICDANPAGKNPATTIYTYCLALRKIAGKIDAIDALTAREAAGGQKGDGKKRGAKPEGEAQPEVKLLTVDDAIAAILDAHKAGTLTAPQYAKLQGLIPAPVRTRHMGDVVEIKAPALQAA